MRLHRPHATSTPKIFLVSTAYSFDPYDPPCRRADELVAEFNKPFVKDHRDFRHEFASSNCRSQVKKRLFIYSMT
jgi:hypothetical protein